jgi:hypothetical protein
MVTLSVEVRRFTTVAVLLVLGLSSPALAQLSGYGHGHLSSPLSPADQANVRSGGSSVSLPMSSPAGSAQNLFTSGTVGSRWNGVVLPYIKQQPNGARTSSPLVVEGSSANEPNSNGDFNLGTVNLNLTMPITHTFVLKNRTATTVTATHIGPTCECNRLRSATDSVMDAYVL